MYLFISGMTKSKEEILELNADKQFSKDLECDGLSEIGQNFRKHGFQKLNF